MKKSSPKEKQTKSKGKSPSRDKKKKKSEGKGTTSGAEPSPKLGQEGGGNVHDLAKKFTVGFSSGGSSPSAVEDVSGRVQKGSVASAVQRLEENIKEKQAIDLTDYEVTGGGEEHEEDVELSETDEEDEEMLDDNEELKESDQWMDAYRQRWRFRDDSVIQLCSGCGDDSTQVSGPGMLWVEKYQAVLSQKLNELRRCYHIQEVKGTLEILNFLYRNIVEDPCEETYRRIRLASDQYRKHICSHPEALQFMWSCGWMEVDRCMVLPMERSLAFAMPVLDQQIQLADLVLQSHHLNQWLDRKNEASASRVSSGTVQQGPSAGLTTTTSNVAEEAGGDRIFDETDSAAVCSRQPESEGGLRQKTSTYGLYLSQEELEDLESMISAEKDKQQRGRRRKIIAPCNLTGPSREWLSY